MFLHIFRISLVALGLWTWALLTASPGLADEWEETRDEFRQQMRSESWAERRDAFVLLTTFDGQKAVEEILSALGRETNGVVVSTGLETLGLLVSPEAEDALLEAARKGKGRRRLLVILALEKQKGPAIEALLLEAATGKDPQVAAQAARVLGEREVLPSGALPVLQKLLQHKDWQVRSAAARTLLAHPDKAAVPALAQAFAKADGRDRADLIAALEKTTGQDFGNDIDAWKRFAKGEDPAGIRRKPKEVPTVFGVPIYGKRVVIVLDNSLRMSDPNPYDAERLRELCDVEDGAPIPWFRMKTNGQFALGHVRHLISGFQKGTKFALLPFNLTVQNAFEGFVPAGSAARKRATDVLDSLIEDDGIASYDALMAALDIAGWKDASAWRKGPDEIIFITVNIPTAGAVKEADVIAAAVGLKARLRMVPIHTVGIHLHPYDMCRNIATRSGGTYVNLVK